MSPSQCHFNMGPSKLCFFFSIRWQDLDDTRMLAQWSVAVTYFQPPAYTLYILISAGKAHFVAARPLDPRPKIKKSSSPSTNIQG